MPLSQHKNRKTSVSSSVWNMLSISVATATSSFLNRIKTPVRGLFKCGPCISSLLSDVPPNSAAAPYTTRTLCLFGLITPWCGKYYSSGRLHLQTILQHTLCQYSHSPLLCIALQILDCAQIASSDAVAALLLFVTVNSISKSVGVRGPKPLKLLVKFHSRLLFCAVKLDTERATGWLSSSSWFVGSATHHQNGVFIA